MEEESSRERDVPMAPPITKQRKSIYYAGGICIMIGILIFASLFFFPPPPFSNSGPLRMGLTMILMVGGGILRIIGAAGLAGSGAILDPDQARRDLEPYSRQVGGMLKDVLDEANIALPPSTAPIIMIKCRVCGVLSNEHARFCQGCGASL